MNKDNINTALDEGKGVSDNVDELLTEIKNAKDETAPISTSTVTSLIMSVIVLINTIFLIFGVDKHIDENVWYQAGSVIALVANIAYATWKNHNITKAARKRQQVGEVVVPKNRKDN